MAKLLVCYTMSLDGEHHVRAGLLRDAFSRKGINTSDLNSDSPHVIETLFWREGVRVVSLFDADAEITQLYRCHLNDGGLIPRWACIAHYSVGVGRKDATLEAASRLAEALIVGLNRPSPVLDQEMRIGRHPTNAVLRLEHSLLTRPS